MSEGGGITKTYPFEIWRYRFIEGIGPDVELEFVDTSGTNEFRLTINPQEKDALVRAGSGPTEFEQAGLESRYQRLQRVGLATNYIGPTKDLPFERMARQAVLDKPPPLKFTGLHEIVTASITYSQIPLYFRYGYVRLGEDGVLALLNVEVENRALTFGKGENVLRADVEVYGRVVDMLGKVQAQFEETLAAEFSSLGPEQVSRGRSLLQRNVYLKPGTYRLDLAVKDRRSGQLGTSQQRLVIPDTRNANLWASPVILARSVEEAGGSAPANDPYLLGPLRIYPQIGSSYSRSETLRAYYQVYNVRIDPSSQMPSLTVRYHLLREGRLEFSRIDAKGETIHFVSERRVAFLVGISMARFQPGSYRLLAQITDNASGEITATETFFALTP
jgi:hypothetical protein